LLEPFFIKKVRNYLRKMIREKNNLLLIKLEIKNKLRKERKDRKINNT
jgi:hypothetical protein